MAAGQKVKPKRRAVRKRALASPPAELLVLPHKATLSQLRKAAAATMRDLYRMFDHFEVGTDTMHMCISGMSHAGSLLGTLQRTMGKDENCPGVGREERQGGPVQVEQVGGLESLEQQNQRVRLDSVPDGTAITLHGSSLTSAHAGGMLVSFLQLPVPSHSCGLQESTPFPI
jgi:hypothetical protein